MEILLSKFSKMYLSVIVNILSSIIIIILLVNQYTTLDINLNFSNSIISINCSDFKETSEMWSLAILLYINLLKGQIVNILSKIFSDDSAYYKALTVVNTIIDIMNLSSSIYGFIFVIIANNFQTTNVSFYDTPLAWVTYIGIIYNFVDFVYYYFYSKNNTFIQKFLAKKNNNFK